MIYSKSENEINQQESATRKNCELPLFLHWCKRKAELDTEFKKHGYNNASLDDLLKALELPEISDDEKSRILSLMERYKGLEEEKLPLWTEELNAIDELNQKHAAVNHGQFYILTKKTSSKIRDFHLESKQSFLSTYENKFIMGCNGKMISKASVWIKSPLRNEYKDIIFDPNNTSDEVYNLWQGFSVDSAKGDCQLFLDHIRNNICSDKDEIYKYLINWVAKVFQSPTELHTGIVLRGAQGTGKNTFVDVIGKLLGSHYIPLTSLNELSSHFNAHLKYGILINANEAIWGGDKRDIGKIKAMITDSKCLIECKGKDPIVVDNFKHIIICSNEDWPISLDSDDRRFFVIDVSNKHKKDDAYFKSIREQLNNGGYEALLYLLLHTDVSKFNPRVFPKSEGAFDIKLRSASSSHRYIYEALNEGCFDIGKADPGGVWHRIPVQLVYDDYVEWSQKSGERQESKGVFGKSLKTLIPSIQVTRSANAGSRIREYDVPSLNQAREEFCKKYKSGGEIWDDGVSCDAEK